MLLGALGGFTLWHELDRKRIEPAGDRVNALLALIVVTPLLRVVSVALDLIPATASQPLTFRAFDLG